MRYFRLLNQQDNPAYFGVGIVFALVFLLIALIAGEWLNVALLIGLIIGFAVASVMHDRGYTRSAVHFGVGAMVSYQWVLLYLYRDVPNIGLVWFMAGPAIVARFGHTVDILIWTPICLLATVICYQFVAQYPLMQHPMSLPNLLGVLTLNSVVCYRFIAERMKRERQLLLAASDSEKAERRSTHLLASLSHELRSPMTSILLSSEMLRNRSIAPDSQEDLVEGLYQSALVTTNLLNDVLELAKVEAKLTPLVRETFSPLELLNEIQTTLDPLAKANGTNLLLLLSPESPAQWCSNKVAIRQILVNLLSNGIKHCPNGTVTLSFDVVGEQLDMLVSDTGVGIPLEQQALIFDPFISLSNEVVGTGLGLTLARGYAENLGGSLQLIESTPGKGTTFCFSMPSAEVKPTCAEVYSGENVTVKRAVISPMQPRQMEWLRSWCEVFSIELVADCQAEIVLGPDLRNLALVLDCVCQSKSEETSVANSEPLSDTGTCLICDDNEQIREVMTHVLVSLGYEVRTAADPEEAMAQLDEHQIDFMILDVQLADESGVVLLKRLRESTKPYAQLPVCMLSGSLDGKALAEEVGSDYYLLKPAGRSELQSVATEMMKLAMQPARTIRG